jgi:hypothetical protein
MAVVSLLCVAAVLLNVRPSSDEQAGKRASSAQPEPLATRELSSHGSASTPPAQGEPVQPPKTATPQPAPVAQPTAADAQEDSRSGRSAQTKAEPPQPPVDPNAPRHVVLRPIPANVSIGIDGSPLQPFGPSFRSVNLKPGPHEFTFQGALDCCIDETITVNIPPGVGSYVLSHRLRYRAANLIVASNTPADVVVDDGKARGRTWSIIAIPQPNDMIGMHVVRVSAAGHRDAVREVRLRAGQLERIEVVLEKVPEVAPPPG